MRRELQGHNELQHVDEVAHVLRVVDQRLEAQALVILVLPVALWRVCGETSGSAFTLGALVRSADVIDKGFFATSGLFHSGAPATSRQRAETG